MCDDEQEEELASGSPCPECGDKMFSIMPSWNGRNHTCGKKGKAKKKCNACVFCQTCLKARLDYWK